MHGEQKQFVNDFQRFITAASDHCLIIVPAESNGIVFGTKTLRY